VSEGKRDESEEGKMRGTVGAVLAGVGLGVTILASSASAKSPALHAFCVSPTPTCTDNGMNTPTSTNPPDFGFTISSGPATGTLLLDVLVPNNEDTAPGALSFDITSLNSGPTGTASLFSTTAWTDSKTKLDSYLGITASPANPLGAFLPATQKLDPDATGFFVYQADLGSTMLEKQGTNSGPEFSIDGGLPLGSYVLAFLGSGDTYSATANSGALFETGTPVPEPSALLAMCLGLAGMAWARRARRTG
jgi:hypothetical protein